MRCRSPSYAAFTAGKTLSRCSHDLLEVDTREIPDSPEGNVGKTSGRSRMAVGARSFEDGSMTQEPPNKLNQGSDPTVENTAQSTQTTVARRLTRRTDDKMVAGVASGLGHYFRVDPVVFRIGFVVTAFVGGAGLLAYILAWLLIPEAGTNRSEAERVFQGEREFRGRTWLGIALLLLGVTLLVGQVGWWDPGLIWGFALIAVGVILFKQDANRPPPTEPPPPAAETAAAPIKKPTTEEPVVVAERPRSALGWLTAGTALIAVGLASVLVEVDLVSLEVGQFFGIALAVLGAGLVVGAWWGRARLLIIAGLLLAPVTVAASAVRVPVEGGVGERLYVPRSATEVRDEYRLGAGEMVIDFTRTDFSGQPLDVEATVVAGRLEVIVPSDVTVDVNGRIGVGEMSLFGRRQNGAELEDDRVVQGSQGSLNLDLETSFGEIEVYHQSTAD
jgi:phage shock protein PspC (stress-responsive transcriptional regulator)